MKIKIKGFHDPTHSFHITIYNGNQDIRDQDKPHIRRTVRDLLSETQKRLGYDIKYPLKLVYKRPVIYNDYFCKLEDQYGDVPLKKMAIAKLYHAKTDEFIGDLSLYGFGEEIMLHV